MYVQRNIVALQAVSYYFQTGVLHLAMHATTSADYCAVLTDVHFQGGLLHIVV